MTLKIVRSCSTWRFTIYLSVRERKQEECEAVPNLKELRSWGAKHLVRSTLTATVVYATRLARDTPP